MIKINKQLTRLDGGPLASGSIIEFNPTPIAGFESVKPCVIFRLTHWYKDTSRAEKFQSVSGVTNFTYKLSKELTTAEWDELNTQANAGVLMNTWLKELIDNEIGVGNTEII